MGKRGGMGGDSAKEGRIGPLSLLATGEPTPGPCLPLLTMLLGDTVTGHQPPCHFKLPYSSGPHLAHSPEAGPQATPVQSWKQGCLYKGSHSEICSKMTGEVRGVLGKPARLSCSLLEVVLLPSADRCQVGLCAAGRSTVLPFTTSIY